MEYKTAGRPGVPMPDYRLYCLDKAGKFTASHEFTAASDAEALTIVKAMRLRVRCELWERSRMVAQLPLAPVTDQEMSASSCCGKDA